MQRWMIPAYKQGRNGMMNTAFALHVKPGDGGPMMVNVSSELHETSTMSMP